MPQLIRLIYLALFLKICLFLLPREAILCLMVSSMIRLMELQWDLLWVQFLQTFLRAILKKSGYCTDARGIVLAKQKTITRTNHSVRFGVWSHHIIKHGRGRVNYPLILAVVGLSNFPGHFRRHEYFLLLCVNNWTVWYLEFIFSLDWNRAIELKNSEKFSTKLFTGRIHPELQSLPFLYHWRFFSNTKKNFHFPLPPQQYLRYFPWLRVHFQCRVIFTSVRT